MFTCVYLMLGVFFYAITEEGGGKQKFIHL